MTTTTRSGSFLLTVLLALNMGVAVAAAETSRGETIAAQGNGAGALACVTCHGADGKGNSAAGFPALAGLDSGYLSKQLHDYASGSRQNPVMQPLASALTDDDIQAVTAYYQSLGSPISATTQRTPNPDNQGEWLAIRGDWDQLIPACNQCHGPYGMGVGSTFPSLAGQSASYLKAQLNAWRNGSRENDPDQLMKGIADRLSEEQIGAITEYYATLPEQMSVQTNAQESRQEELPAAPQGQGSFQAPREQAIPANQYGDMVRKGRDLFVDTQQLRGKYVFNGQNCVNCHLDAGRMANSAPMWGAVGMYPAYRGKNDKVNTLSMRIQGCFTYSMNGIPPKLGDETLLALETYFHWLATGAPINQALPGRGYAKLEMPEGGYDRERGAKLYTEQCAVCHGADGGGQVVAGKVVFPPLWGDEAYNWGAGMHRVNTAAGFIKGNMPLGKPNSLSDQDAWDLAAFVNSQERPQDPRRRNQESLDSTAKTFHNHDGFYGKELDGKRLGDHRNYGKTDG